MVLVEPNEKAMKKKIDDLRTFYIKNQLVRWVIYKLNFNGPLIDFGTIN